MFSRYRTVGLYSLNNKNSPAVFLQLIFLEWVNSSPVHPSTLSLSCHCSSLSLPFWSEGKISRDWLTIKSLLLHLGNIETLILCQSFIFPPNTIPDRGDVHWIWGSHSGEEEGVPSSLSPTLHPWAGFGWDHCSPSSLLFSLPRVLWLWLTFWS